MRASIRKCRPDWRTQLFGCRVRSRKVYSRAGRSGEGSRRGHWQDCILTGLGRYLHSGFPRQTMEGKAKVPRKKPAIWELGLSKRLQKSGQVRSLFVAQLDGDRGVFAFNSNVKEHLIIAPRIPRFEIFYIRKNVWLNAIDLHCHRCPSGETGIGRRRRKHPQASSQT